MAGVSSDAFQLKASTVWYHERQRNATKRLTLLLVLDASASIGEGNLKPGQRLRQGTFQKIYDIQTQRPCDCCGVFTVYQLLVQVQ
ncbi:hypothetical protein OS493_028446 [Desmophyllum pertusum]|uniref:Uncharacterized protein n=1 Tax=Desmophyllum pertusum TaxID=174260 RepID=A0A9X0D159_9CNID|nr:hypothetical protein OS493_028446 [Desmophyllum pertusum]